MKDNQTASLSNSCTVNIIQVDAGVGQGSDSEDDDDDEEEDSVEDIIDHTLHTRTQPLTSNNIISSTEKTSKRLPTVSESSDVSMIDAEEETT